MQRTSDLVARFLELHQQNSTRLKPIRFSQPVPPEIEARLRNESLTFESLPPLLQRAVLWDSGYSLGEDDSLAQIFTLCGVSMAEVALPATVFNASSCVTQSCDSASGTPVGHATMCAFDELAAVARCSCTAVSTQSNGSLWSNASSLPELPEVRVRRHSWVDAEREQRVHIYALHTAPEADPCGSRLVIPCVPFQRTDPRWCRPPPSAEMTAWLRSFARSLRSENVSTSVATRVDGTSSDLAKQLHRLHTDGAVVAPMALDGSLPAAITKRLDAVSLQFSELPPLLQRALVWDSGFAYGDGNRLAAVFVPCGRSMANLGVTRRAFNLAGCVEHNCSDAASGAVFSRSLQCTGDQIAAVSQCATTAVTTAVHAAMWADGGDDALVPTPTVLRHAWESSNRSFLIYSIHTAGAPVAYGRCPARGAMIIPCLPYEAVSSSRQWCRPQPSALVNAWLRDVANDHAFSLWLLVPVLLAAAAAVTGLACCLRHKSWRRLQRWRPASKGSPHSHTTVSLRELSGDFEGQGFPQEHERRQWWFGSASLTSRASVESAESPTALHVLTSHPELAGRRLQFNDLQLQRLLATGGHGEVWLCELHGAPVAVKRRLRGRRGRSGGDDLAAFVAEIVLTASLDHPHVLRFLGVAWSSPANLCMVTEYLPNGDLQAFLRDHGSGLTWGHEKLRVATGVAAALAYLHARRPPTIHRDLKAKNVLLSELLDAKLMDFGGSRQKTGDMLTNGVGTPYWTAPEILQGATYAESADIYSFGVVLCELDTARTPYDALPLTPLQILERVAADSLRPSLSSDCPASIAALVVACLQHDASARPSARELLALLQDSAI
ncbi:hypothetical protein P43SY_008006 [Pythium insidiosum]|uniref:Protein kinase domain-containing protein n=1 Tax=Pythium insidiosum TaxID=114742 RepID=A0AAD5LN71_PYTIN|nr:hypothetical protein P43SY_008006 [Pythium insidiosum]